MRCQGFAGGLVLPRKHATHEDIGIVGLAADTEGTGYILLYCIAKIRSTKIGGVLSNS